MGVLDIFRVAKYLYFPDMDTDRMGSRPLPSRHRN
jgi:hypothetical protein